MGDFADDMRHIEEDAEIERLLEGNPWQAKPLTPYDTGARLEPKPWVKDGDTGNEYIRPAIPDDYGKVDFDDDEGATVLTVYVEKSPHGYVMHAQTFGPDTVGLMWNKAT